MIHFNKIHTWRSEPNTKDIKQQAKLANSDLYLSGLYMYMYSYTNDLYMDSSVSSGFTNFAINSISILKLMGVVYYKWRPIVSRLL